MFLRSAKRVRLNDNEPVNYSSSTKSIFGKINCGNNQPLEFKEASEFRYTSNSPLYDAAPSDVYCRDEDSPLEFNESSDEFTYIPQSPAYDASPANTTPDFRLADDLLPELNFDEQKHGERDESRSSSQSSYQSNSSLFRPISETPTKDDNSFNLGYPLENTQFRKPEPISLHAKPSNYFPIAPSIQRNGPSPFASNTIWIQNRTNILHSMQKSAESNVISVAFGSSNK